MSDLAGHVSVAAIGGHPAGVEPVFADPVERISEGYDFIGAIRKLCADRPSAAVAYIYDAETTVLPPGIPERIEALRRRVAGAGQIWLMAAAAGVDLFNDSHLTAAYHAEAPRFLTDPALRPLRRVTSDPLLVNLALLRSTALLEKEGIDTVNALLDAGLRQGFASIYAPHLGATKTNAGRSERLGTSFAPAPIDDRDLDLARRTMRRTYCTLPGISVVTRTTGSRSHLLRRLGVSLARAAAPVGASLEWVIVGGEEAISEIKPVVDELGLPPAIETRLHVREPRPEMSDRVANLAAGFDAASRPNVWILDDDDYVTPEGLGHVATAYFLGEDATPILGSSVMEEEWEYPAAGPPVLTSSRHRKDYPSSDWTSLYQGWNPLPICAYIVPTSNTRAVMEGWGHSADLSEDYFLLLDLLSNTDLPPVAEVPWPVVGISLRLKERDSAMGLEDRSPWLRDIVDHAIGFLADADSPARIQLIAGATAAGSASAVPDTTDRLEQRVYELEARLRESEALRRRLAAELIRRAGGEPV